MGAPDQRSRDRVTDVPVGFYRTVTQELSRLGFKYESTRRHEVWVNASGRKLTVPYNLSSKHTANGILKDAGSSLRV